MRRLARREVTRWVLALVLFALLSAIVMVPLSLHLGSMVPGWPNGKWDYYHFQWNLWWVRHALATGQNPFYTDMVLAPFEHNLAYHSLTPVWLPVYLVLSPLGVTAAANLIVGLSLVLTGWLMAVFLRRQGMSRATALIGGVALGFCPYMLDHAASGHLNLITVFWLPLVLLLWERVATTRRAGWAILTGAALWALWLSDTLVVLWGGLLLAPYALLTLAQARDRAARGRIVLLGGLALLITLALAWFIAPLQPTLDYDTSTLAPAELFTLRTFSSSPTDLIVRPWREGPRHAQEGEENLGRVLIVLLALALIVRVRDRRRWFWLGAAIVPLVLSFGPDVDVFGTRVPLPFRLIHETFGGQMRTPIRFLAAAMVPLIVFLACSFDPWLRRVRSGAGRGALAGGVALLLLWDFGALKAFPHSPALPQYDFYTMIGREQYDDYDQVVLEVPAAPSTGWLLLGDHPEAMAYGTVHGKRMLSGLISRAPIEQHLYYQESPLIGWLSGVRPLDAGRAIGELRQLVDEWPVGYVVVHLDWLTFERQAEILALFNAHPALCYLGAEGDALLYRTTSHPAGCPPRTPPEAGPGVYRIDIGLRGDAGYLGHGWFWAEDFGGVTSRWAGGTPEALIYAGLPPGADYRFTVRAVAFAEPRTVRVVANGERLGSFTVSPGDWSEHTLAIPAALVEQVGGELVISLAADGMRSAAEMGLSADERPLTLAYDWFEFRAGEGE